MVYGQYYVLLDSNDFITCDTCQAYANAYFIVLSFLGIPFMIDIDFDLHFWSDVTVFCNINCMYNS